VLNTILLLLPSSQLTQTQHCHWWLFHIQPLFNHDNNTTTSIVQPRVLPNVRPPPLQQQQTTATWQSFIGLRRKQQLVYIFKYHYYYDGLSIY